MQRHGSRPPTSRLDAVRRDHPLLFAFAAVVAAVAGALLLLATMFSYHPVLGFIVLLGCVLLMLLSLVRVVGLAKGSMRRGEVDRFILAMWLRPARGTAVLVGAGAVVFVWLVVGIALSALVLWLVGPEPSELDAVRQERGDTAAGVVFLVIFFIGLVGVPAVGSLLTWRRLRRYLGPPRAPKARSWLGGRVEMPEHGFTLAIPEGWVALEWRANTSDVWSMVQERDDYPTPRAVRMYIRQIARGRSQGAQLVVIGRSGGQVCDVLVQAADRGGLDATVDRESAFLNQDPRFTERQPPRSIRLPAGKGYVLAATVRMPDDPEDTAPVRVYVVEDRGSTGVLFCCARQLPDDEFLSLAKGLELFYTPDPQAGMGVAG